MFVALFLMLLAKHVLVKVSGTLTKRLAVLKLEQIAKIVLLLKSGTVIKMNAAIK